MPEQKIVAIGGGSIGWGGKKPEVTPLSLEIIRLSGKKKPKLIFIPTASSDDLAYVRLVQNHFGRKLNCEVSALFLHKARPKFSEIRGRVLAADIVYVGGGNTLLMMNRWKKLGVDKILREARSRGKVLCGTSAGALCWFRRGNSDSWKYYNPKAPLIKIKGLGFLEGLGCPHYDGEKDRAPQLKSMMKKTPGVAVALDNCAALEVVGNQWRVLASKSTANAYRVYWKRGGYFRDILDKGPVWKPLERLWVKA